ncbi:electroneutral sodium bicarbonate exchanger 1-like isoform X2 [Babylonia areolata]|uniref:electroneutral sodium bicarbonate exchanger 1-like isoform X2 n=1 Tax=Babylonia areolata TaxID=304850 RepID=UPI003FD1F3A1
MSRMADQRVDTSMPVKDHGSFVFHAPSDADIQDHRKQDTVYIGLHLPRQQRPHRHRPRHHKHKKSRDDNRGIREEPPMGSEGEHGAGTSAAPPSQRVQFLLGEEEDEDHKTHDVFCEMAELFPSSEDPNIKEWKETARWIKFEEDVEEGGERWSKPHVATLSLHSLFELRCSLLQGTVMLDMDATTLDQVIGLVLDNMIASNQLESNLRDQVWETLMARHRHQNEKRVRHKDESRIHLPFVRSLADIGKKYSEPKQLASQGDERVGTKSTPNISGMHRTNSASKCEGNTLTTNSSFTNTGASTEGGLHEVASHRNLHFMKKIPPGSEASNILVGEVDFLNHQIVAFVRLSKSTILGDITEVPVPTRFVFILLGPMGNQNKFHEIGRSIATLMSDEIFHDVAYHAHNREDLLAGIDEFLDQVTVLPPGEWDPTIRIEPPKSVPSQEGRKTAASAPPQPNGKAVVEEETEEHGDPTLVRTGRIFGGLIDDIKRKAPFYLSDFKDALHIQCLASFIFLYFACLTPIITFGGLLGDATDNNMAALESILAGAICGIVYSLFAGQPLTILGSTGPVLVFESIVNHFCSNNGLNYLEMRLWIGIWTGALLIVMVAFDLSALVRYITRFTEESFAALISLIFIVEAIVKLIRISSDYPINRNPSAVLNYNCSCNLTGVDLNPNITEDSIDTSNCTQFNGTLIGGGCDTPIYYPDIFFFSVLLFLGTFTLSFSLKMSRNASFFPTVVRGTVSDFSVLIAILSMVLLDFLVGVPTPKLHVPDDFAPTSPTRGWVINPVGSNPWWTALAAIIPAMLAVILIFMDQQITAVIVNRKENKLVKGSGYHLDLFIVASLIIICSFLGLPWFVAATVLSINHVNSLKKESQCSAPGEQPKFLGVREQRVTGIFIFMFIGVSVMLTSVLRFIPMPVLYGVFLYMGVSSLRGMQLVDRIAIWFMPAKYQPDYMYLRHVRTNRVHMFTAIQVFCLAVLWVIKSVKSISIAFPIMVLAMCFVRKGLDKLFDQRELKWLDDIMPEAHKRAKEDEKIKQEEQRRSLIEGITSTPLALGLNMEHITIQADIDQVNISEEMSRTALWKSIMHNESSSNLITSKENEESRSSTKQRKPKKHSKKPRDINGSERSHNSPAIMEEDEPTEGSPKKKNAPVKFYIDEHEEEGEKENLIKAPEIVIDPPSDVSRLGSPDQDDSKV